MRSKVLVLKSDKCELYWFIPEGWEQVHIGKFKPWHYCLTHTRGNNFRWTAADDDYLGWNVLDLTLVITRVNGAKDGKPPR